MMVAAVRHVATPIPVEHTEMALAETRLLERASAGDPAAFRLLFDRHAPAVRRFLRDLLGDDAIADEGTQETFVRAHRGLHTIREDGKVLSWLFGIARNVSREQLRARRRLVPVGEAMVDRPADPSLTPEAMLLGREADRALARALAHLSEERRAALLLRIDHGLDYDEIRGVMGWSLAKVKNEIHRARLELRSRLMKYVGGA
jgi:RNA polymerase sigma-70 factor (ECF subfamily)